MDNKPKRGRKPNPEGTKVQYGDTLSIRIDPRLRYLFGLAARRQHRSLSSMIEWAIEDSFQRISLDPNPDGALLAVEGEELWDINEADRFVKVAFRYRDLLDSDQEKIWKVLLDNKNFWREKIGFGEKLCWGLVKKNLIIEKVREKWPLIKKIAAGEAEPSELLQD